MRASTAIITSGITRLSITRGSRRTWRPCDAIFTPLDLKHEIQQVGLDGVVSVQARQSIEETEWLLALAAEFDFILGVVGWLPLAADIRCQIGRWSHFPKLKAVRHVVQDEPDDAFLPRTSIAVWSYSTGTT
ncbi:MAG: hypothetical protein R3C56_39060 [Pirellulaceae bacterium]